METALYYLVVLIAAALIARATAPKPPEPTPPSLDEFDAPTAEEGKAIPVAFGDVWCKSPNVVWYGNLRTSPIKKDGGK